VALSEEDAARYGADDVIYEINLTVPAKLEVNGESKGEITIPENTTDNVTVPTPALVDNNGNPVDYDGTLTFNYEVVDMNGEPFAEGEAPISVDENGEITIINPGQAQVKVSLTGEAAEEYGAEPFI
ncbi:MAG: hypothetical protein K2N91_07585, partial [Muribaculaceae bacterium]|nr:hypothetical protein [Muribaculaceae bacterium]